MADVDRRTGELMVRLRLPRRAATRQALSEVYGPDGPPMFACGCRDRSHADCAGGQKD
jgi:hypothetical protein